MKKPQLLPLDVTTSALDNESQKSVLPAIDSLQSLGFGLTPVTIAHRLSMIRNSSVSFVVKAGRCVEQGTHTELMAARGEYFNLVQSQSNSEDQANYGRGRAESNRTKGAQGAAAGYHAFPRQISPDSTHDCRHDGNAGTARAAPQAANEHEVELARIKELKEMKYKAPWGRLYRLCKPSGRVLPLAFLCSFVAGSGFSVQGYLLRGIGDFVAPATASRRG